MNAISIFLRICPKKRDEFLQTIRSLNLEMKQETGFKLARIFQDLDDSSSFYLIEEWRTQTDIDRHLRSDRFSVLMGLLRVLSEESEVHYHVI